MKRRFTVPSSLIGPERLRRAAAVALLVLGTFAAATLVVVAENSVNLTMTVRPVRNGGPEVTSIDVRTEIRGALEQATTPFSVRAPVVYAGVQNIANRVGNLAVRDATGSVTLVVQDDPAAPGGYPYYRHWRAARKVTSPVVVTYSMRPYVGKLVPGPQFDFYAHAGGISGAGMAMFVLPEIPKAMCHVRWDLTDLAAGSIAASSHGEGDVDVEAPPEDLAQAFYLAGPLGRYAPPESSSGFRAHWLGLPPFAPAREMAWAAQGFEYLRTFWRDTSTKSFHVMVRAVEGATADLGGTALGNSFILATRTGAGDPALTSRRGTIFHEMDHFWVGHLDEDDTEGGSPWFHEGLNVHYTRLLLLRSGLAPVDDYVRDINENASRYYGSPYRNLSADAVARLGFSTGVGAGSAQNQAYARGSLLFADLDARIRAGSGGRRKLDDVILAVFARRTEGERIDRDVLVSAFVKELGPSARDRFDAVIVRGETVVPPSNAFGPCLERRPAKYKLQDKEADGYEWVRVPSVADAACRAW